MQTGLKATWKFVSFTRYKWHFRKTC